MKLPFIIASAALASVPLRVHADPPVNGPPPLTAGPSAFQRGLTMMRTPEDLAWESAGRQEWMRISQPACYGPIVRGAVDAWTGAPLTTCDPPLARMRAYIKAHVAEPGVADEAAHVLLGDPASHGTPATNPLTRETVTVTQVMFGVEAWKARCALEVNFPQMICSTLRDIPYDVDCAKTLPDRLANEKATKTYWENGFLWTMDVNGAWLHDVPDMPTTGGGSVITKHCPRASSDAQVKAWSAEAFAKMMKQESTKKR